MTAVLAPPIAAVVAAVVPAVLAAALYVVAYLAFMRLLRYPRNWFPPSRGAYLGTAALVIPAAVFPALVFPALEFAALLPVALDFAALAAGTAFVAVLFLIIAAPAVTFRPASPLFELLARSGDHVGLWMVIPAVAAAAAIPNAKLQSLLATAVVIEGIWFLRQRWAKRGRRIYPLGEHSISVLRKQAEGDLEGFARKHGIHELLLSDGAVAWRGCGKATLPCPFNFYVNRLGLNAAPCCLEHLEDICHRVTGWLRELDVTHWLEGGTLLGAVREQGNFLAWEDDVDISYLLESDAAWENLAAGIAQRGRREGYFVEIFAKSETIAISYDLPRPWPLRWEHNRMRGEIRVDLVGYRPGMNRGEAVVERLAYKGAMPRLESGRYGVPREVILPTAEITLLGSQFSCPAQPEEHLRILYGNFREVEYSYVDAKAAEGRRQVDDAAVRQNPGAEQGPDAGQG